MRAIPAFLLILVTLAGVSRAETTPAAARFLAAAEAAPQRFHAGKKQLDEIRALREQVLGAPETAAQDEERIYRLVLPGLSGMEEPRQQELLAFERRRSGLLARLARAAKTEEAQHKIFAAKLAAIKIDALTTWLPTELGRLERDLDALLDPRLRTQGLLDARWGTPDLQGRLLAPYAGLRDARDRESLSAAFDAMIPPPAASVLERSQALAPPRLYFGLTAGAPQRTAKREKRTPPQPAGISDKQWTRPLIRRIVRLLDYYGQKLGVYDLLEKAGASDPQAFLLALIKQESGFDPKGPPSSKGAIGLMQVMPRTAADMRIHGDLTDMRTNIRAGLLYLRDALKTFGRLDLALAGYNAGINRVRRAGGIPRIVETQQYVTIILRDYAEMMTPLFLKQKSSKPGSMLLASAL